MHHASKHHRSMRRLGLASGTMVVLLAALTVALALTVGIGRLAEVHLGLQHTCEAAALAGAAELLDDDVLRGDPNPANNVMAAEIAAQRLAQEHWVDGRPVQLCTRWDSNTRPRNVRPGAESATDQTTTTDIAVPDIQVGWVGPPLSPGQPMLPWNAQRRPNSVRVRATRDQLHGNAAQLFFAGLFGRLYGDVAAAARASIDQRVVGFRSEPGVRVPVVPLLVDHDTWHEQAWRTAVSGVNDNYHFDASTGRFMSGSDGIAELELRTPLAGLSDDGGDPSATHGQWAVLLLPDASDDWNLNRFRRQLAYGLSHDDLESSAGRLLAENRARPVFDRVPAEICHCLLGSGAGQPRAWPLGIPTSTDDGLPAWQITGFAAGRLVFAYVDSTDTGDELVAVVQPTTLVSSTALAADGVAENPWLAKLQLTQ